MKLPAFRSRPLSICKIITLLLTLAIASMTQASAQSEFLDGEGMPYAVFDHLPKTDVTVGGGVLQVGFAPGDMDLAQSAVLDWIKTSASAVAGYYGHFPVQSIRLLIVPVDGSGVRGGTTWSYRGAATRVLVGRYSDADDLKRDWMLVHEFVHLALPEVGRTHNWLSEGLATYVEPIARVQAGDLTAEKIWTDMLRDIPKGLPQSGDQGLDVTHTWARTYWGGALFCLLADVEIRKQSGNRLGLQDALRGVLAAGGNHDTRWPIERVLKTADRTTGLTVFSDLYAKMATKPFAPDLDALWYDLGVVRTPSGVEFDNSRSLAAIRAAITARSHDGPESPAKP